MLTVMNRVHGSSCSGERGAALVELLLTLPLLLAILLTAFEIGNLLHIRENVAFIAREAALFAFRECSPYETEVDRDACLGFVRGEMAQFGRAALPAALGDLGVAVTLYDVDENRLHVADDPDLGGFSRRGQLLVDPVNARIDDHERVVLAEVDFVYQPRLFREIAFINFAEFEFYESSLYSTGR